MILLDPLYALLSIPLVIVLVWLLRKDFVPATYASADEIRSRNKNRWLLLFTRSAIIVLICVALAQPVSLTESFTAGEPEITVLVDNSSSMQVLDTSPVSQLLDDLDARLPVRVRMIGQGQRSALGDDVLGLLGDAQNVLLVTDGHVTSGASLQDVAAFAGTINATINAVRLEPSVRDAGIRVLGPEKAVEGVNSTIRVLVSSTHGEPSPIRVLLDDQEIFVGEVQDEYTWQQSLSLGEHTITAEITEEDGIAENNRYLHTMTAVSKPRILYLSDKSSGLERIVDTLYRVDPLRNPPPDLSPYYAIIINDLPSSRLPNPDLLADYLLDGNGLVVVGGQRSFDFGRYQNNVIETVLPVRVGAGERTRGGANIVVAIDLSGSTRGAVAFERGSDGQVREVQSTAGVQSLQKALAISVIEELNPSNSVGVLGFVYPQQFSPSGCSGACVIADVQPLGEGKQELIDKIAAVDLNGGTSLTVGMEGAIEMLRGQSGSRNIIYISDGISNSNDKQQALNAARVVASQGGRVYAVQVGDSADGAVFLQQLAAQGNGVYFRATQANRISILFGEPVDIDQGEAFDLFALNQHHFITQGLDLDATLYGYNQVTPKSGAQMLVTSNGGDPVLTIWNYGVGRVASVNGFNGEDLGGLLTSPTSKLLSRTVNWAIGDPQRKQDLVFDASDGVVGEPVRITASARGVPEVDGLRFIPIGSDLYEATVEQDAVGVYEIADITYAVNYPREFRRVGLSGSLADDLLVSGGAVFDPGDVDAIIDHVKTLQQQQRIQRTDLRWLFIWIAIGIFLLEVFVRRVRDLRKR